MANWTKFPPRILRDRPMDSSRRDFQDRSGIDDAELVVVVAVSSPPSPVPAALTAISCKPMAAMVSEASDSAAAAAVEDINLRFGVLGLLAGEARLCGRRRMILPKNGVVPVNRPKAAIVLQRPCVVIMAKSEREARPSRIRGK